MNELPNVIGPLEIFELILAQVLQAYVCWHAFTQQVGCHGRNQHLRPVCGSSKLSAVIHSGPVIIAAAGVGLTRVHGHSHPKRRVQWPGFAQQCVLDGTCGYNAIRGPMEDREAAVARPAWSDHLAVVDCNQLLDQFIVASQGDAHRIRVPYPSTGAALDIREQEGKGAVEELCRASLSISR